MLKQHLNICCAQESESSQRHLRSGVRKFSMSVAVRSRKVLNLRRIEESESSQRQLSSGVRKFSTSVVLRSLKVLSVTSGQVSESSLRQLRSGPHVLRMDPPIKGRGLSNVVEPME